MYNLCAEDDYKIKVIIAIFYHGSNIDESHHISMCREKTFNVWIEVNNAQVKKK